MMDHSLRRGEQTRNTIVEAAHDLFVQQGYHGTSMRQIAQRAGIALGGLYNHFESKEKVFESVFLEYHPYLQTIPALLAARRENIETFAQDAINSMVAALEDRPDFMNLMFIELVEFNSVQLGELFTSLMPTISSIVQGVIETNQDRLRSIPPMMLMRFYFGMLFSYYMTDKIFAKYAPPEFQDGAMDYYIDIFLHGVMRADIEHRADTDHRADQADV